MKNNNKKKTIILFYLVLFAPVHSYAFEVKPIAIKSAEWLRNIKSFTPKNNDYSEDCNGLLYKVFKTHPVHELITANATLIFCNKEEYKESIKIDDTHSRFNVFQNECNLRDNGTRLGNGSSSSNDPILSGAFFNDDPTGRLRREESGLWGKICDYIKAKKFSSAIDTPNSSTYESHNGKNQFLHSMSSCSSEKATQTRMRAIRYIASNYNLARYIDEKLRSPTSDSIEELRIFLKHEINPDGIYGFFISNNSEDSAKGFPQSLTYEQLFSYGQSFNWGEDSKQDYEKSCPDEQVRSKARALALLALGSALHVIQDSYSLSHVERSNSGLIKTFYQYSNGDNIPSLTTTSPQFPKHCQHDSYIDNNKKEIFLARDMSAKFLMQMIPSKANAYTGKPCFEEMVDWLTNSIFAMTSDEETIKLAHTPHLDTCTPQSPFGIR